MGRILMIVALGGAVLASPSIAADAGKGKAVFQGQCSICHAAVAGKPSGIGPNLYGVIGRVAGTLPKYQYSSAMKAAHFAWSADRLRAYLPAPSKAVPGNKMPYAGLKNPQQLNDLIAYLATLK